MNVDLYRANHAQALALALDEALINQAARGLDATVEAIYQIFRSAELVAYCSPAEAAVRDRAQAAFTKLRGYPITWPALSSFVYR